MTCQMPGCTREALRSSSGALYAYCAEDTRRVVSNALSPATPEPVSWHDRARANRLPTLIVGGVPDSPRGAEFPRLGVARGAGTAPVG